MPAGEQHTEQPLNTQQADMQSQSTQQHQLVTGLIMVNMAEFLSMDLPERGFLLEPVIPTQGIIILYAPRGIGKTFTALSMSLAVAGGLSLYNWQASKPNKVLYVDGEMPAITMQERLKALALGMAAPEIAMQNLSLITPDMQNRPMPDLATAAGQQALEPFLEHIDLLVLDNISTLCRTGKENESQSWQPMQKIWLLDLRRRGIAVLLVHHAGKSGDQRGASAREDIMDTVIITPSKSLQYGRRRKVSNSPHQSKKHYRQGRTSF